MKWFRNGEGNLKVGWKLVRVILLAVLYVFLLLLLPNLFGIHKVSSMYIIHPSIILAVITVLILEKRSLKNIGFKLVRNSLPNFLMGILFASISIVTVYYSMILSGEMKLDILVLRNLFKLSTITLLLYYLLVSVAEELLFRGYVIRTLNKDLNTLLTLVISAAVFSGMHFLNQDYNALSFAAAFLAGFLLGYIFIKTGSLWMCFGYHFMWNYLQDILGFPAQGGEGIFCIVILVSLILFWVMGRSSRFKFVFSKRLKV